MKGPTKDNGAVAKIETGRKMAPKDGKDGKPQPSDRGRQPISFRETDQDRRKAGGQNPTNRKNDTSPQRRIDPRRTEPSPPKRTDPSPQRRTDPASQRRTDPASQRRTDQSPQKRTDPSPQRRTDPSQQKRTDPSPQRGINPANKRQLDPSPPRPRGFDRSPQRKPAGNPPPAPTKSKEDPAKTTRPPPAANRTSRDAKPPAPRASQDGRRKLEKKMSRSNVPGDPDEGTGATVRSAGDNTKRPRRMSFSRTTSAVSQAHTDASDDDQDHVNVVIRVRPQSANEVSKGDSLAVQFPGDGAVWMDNNGTTKPYTFNVTFEPEATQMDVFENSGIIRLIDMALNGYSCTAFAFGQTGSGKTHTITGPAELLERGRLRLDEEKSGLIPRSFQHLWRQLRELTNQGATYTLQASYLEIYNEQCIDLLNPANSHHLNVRWSKNKGFYVENLFVVDCENMDDMMAVLEEGLRNRQTGSHNLNEHSSRSHTMLQLMLNCEQQEPEDESLYITKRGKLTFVDLAGSEKVKDSGSTGETLTETNNINKSLLVLGNCISALGDPKKRQGHIPYRDSKLTKLLADSIGGNGVTLMIACISPASTNTQESIKTLRYASRAKKIKNKPVVRMDPRESLILNLKREVKILRQENHYLRQQLEFPAKPKGHLSKTNDKEVMEVMKKQQQQQGGGVPGSDLYEMLQEYMIENETLRHDNSDMQRLKERIHREQEFLSKENERLSRRLETLQYTMARTPQSLPASLGVSRNGSQDYYEGSPLSTPHNYGYPQQMMNGWMGQTPPKQNMYDTAPPNGPRRVNPAGQAMKPPHHLPGNHFKEANTYGQRHQLKHDLRSSQPEFSPPAPQHRGPPPTQPYYHTQPQAQPMYSPGAYGPGAPIPQGAPVYQSYQPAYNSDPVTPRGQPPVRGKGTNPRTDGQHRSRQTDVINRRNDVMRNELDDLDNEIRKQRYTNEVMVKR